MQNRNLVFSKDKYLHLSELGTRLGLSFSSHVLLGSRLIALDGIKKKLLVLEKSSAGLTPHVIDLDKIASVSVRKNYSSIRPGELNKKEIDEFLRTIDLQFTYRDHPDIFVLPFYEAGVNDRRSLAMLEKNARSWQLILSKMLSNGKSVIAPRPETLLMAQLT